MIDLCNVLLTVHLYVDELTKKLKKKNKNKTNKNKQTKKPQKNKVHTCISNNHIHKTNAHSYIFMHACLRIAQICACTGILY